MCPSKVKASTFKAKSLALLTSFSSGVLGHSNAKWGKKNILKIEDNSFYCVGMGDLEWQRKKPVYLLLLRGSL